MTALSGVLNSCDMLARNSDFARLAASARSVSRMYFLLRSTSSRGFCASALRATLRSRLVGISRPAGSSPSQAGAPRPRPRGPPPPLPDERLHARLDRPPLAARHDVALAQA